MIAPPVFSTVSGDTAVRAALGSDPVRVFPFGTAPDNVALPYAVWQVFTGGPENYVGNLPDLDSFVVQVDVYGASPTSVRAAAEALRDALEPVHHIVGWRGESRDVETRRFRFSFDVEFLTPR